MIATSAESCPFCVVAIEANMQVYDDISSRSRLSYLENSKDVRAEARLRVFWSISFDRDLNCQSPFVNSEAESIGSRHTATISDLQPPNFQRRQQTHYEQSPNYCGLGIWKPPWCHTYLDTGRMCNHLLEGMQERERSNLAEIQSRRG